MKFELIKPINSNYSTIEQILSNRDIPIEQINHYLHTTEEDINPPELLGEQNLKQGAAAVVQTIQSGKTMAVIVDCDCDGYTSSAIFINYLYTLFPTYVENNVSYFVHDSKQHGLSDTLPWLSNRTDLGLVVCPDSSSNDYDYHKKLKEAGIKILVLDHHQAEQKSQDAIIINNQLSDYPNKQFSGAGVTWQFCRYLDKLLNVNQADQYRDLVALGCDADMMSLRSIQTKHLISTGLASPRNPFIVKIAQRNSFSLKGKLTPIGVAFYIAPFVNAMTRSGTIEEKTLLFESMLSYKAFTELPSTKRGHGIGETEILVDQAIRVATNVKNRQTKAQDAFLLNIETKIQKDNLLDHKVLLFLLQPGEVDKNIAGLVANKIMAKYQRPVCMLTASQRKVECIPPWEDLPDATDSLEYAGSARGCDKTGINDFKSICLATGVCNYAEGHPGAFGVSIDAANIDTFIQKTDQLLADMNDEAIYFVDYIYDSFAIDTTNIFDIANMDNLWGKDIDEPYIAIKNLKVTPDMVTIYDKRGYTIKITLPGNISLLKFHASEQDCEILQTNNTGFIEINLVGRCNENEWNGFITPQVFIEDYQVIDSNKYYF